MLPIAFVLLQLPLERFVPAIERIAERTTDAAWVVPDDEVRRLERELGALLGVPAPWRLELRPPPGADRVPASIYKSRGDESFELVKACFVGRAGCELEFSTTVDAQWLKLDSTLFIGADGATSFAREQHAKRTGFLPLRAFPLVLETLDAELRALPLDGYEVAYVGLESPQALGPAPSVRCTLTLRNASELTLFQAELNGVIALPQRAAHDAGFGFRGTLASADSVIGPAISRKTLGTCFREALAARAVLPEAGWTLDVFVGGGSDELRAFAGVNEPKASPALAERWTLELRARARDRANGEPELDFSLGDLPVRIETARALLVAIHGACDVARERVFSVTTCAPLSVVDVVFVPRTLTSARPAPGRGLRFKLTPDGRLEGQETFVTSEISVLATGDRLRWSCVLEGSETLAWSIYRPSWCDVGEETEPRATLGQHALRVIGGGVLQPGLFGS